MFMSDLRHNEIPFWISKSSRYLYVFICQLEVDCV